MGLEVRRVDRSVASTEDPTLEEAGNSVDAGHDDVSRIGRRGQPHSLVVLGEVVVGAPSVGPHHRARCDRLAYEGYEAGARGVGKVAQANAAESLANVPLGGDYDDAIAGASAVFVAVVNFAWRPGPLEVPEAGNLIRESGLEVPPARLIVHPGDLAGYRPPIAVALVRRDILKKEELTDYPVSGVGRVGLCTREAMLDQYLICGRSRFDILALHVLYCGRAMLQ